MKKMMGLWEGLAPPRLGRRPSPDSEGEDEEGERRMKKDGGSSDI